MLLNLGIGVKDVKRMMMSAVEGEGFMEFESIRIQW